MSYHYGEYIDYDVTSNALGCQLHCANHPNCRYFTYYTSNHKCYRKAGSDKRAVEGAISGIV